MTFEEMKAQLQEQILQQQLIAATISQPRMKSHEIKRIKLKPLMLKDVYHIQIEYQYERILKHENVQLAQFPTKLEAFFRRFSSGTYRLYWGKSTSTAFKKKQSIMEVR